MNQDINILERFSTISFAPSALTSRNHSNKQSKKKPEIMKLSITSRRSIKKPHSLHTISKNILISNNRKYNSTPEIYEKNIITSIIFDDRKKIVSIFKNYLLWEETSEFFKRYYSRKESLSRIPKISSYYENYTLFSPIYFAFSLSLVKLMNRFAKRKKRYLEYLEDKEERESIIKENANEQYSRLIKPSQINTQMLQSTMIYKYQEEQTLTLSKISVENSQLSFSELINNTISDVYVKEEKIKSKKFILKKSINSNKEQNTNKVLPTSNKIIGVQIPKINLQGITKFITESNLNKNKRNTKQTQMITYTNSKTMSNNSINKQIRQHLTTTAKLYSNKTKAIINKDLQSKSNKVNFNVNVNLNVNFNININNNNNHNRQGMSNKLVLTSFKNNIRHKMLIAERNKNDLIIPKIIQNSGATHVKTKRFLDNDNNTQPLKLKNANQEIKLDSVLQGSSNIKAKRATVRHIDTDKGQLISNFKTKNLKHLTEIPKIFNGIYPLTTRGFDEKKGISGSVISRLINNNNLKSNTNAKKNKGQSILYQAKQ